MTADIGPTARLIWSLSLWPAPDRTTWVNARDGTAPGGRENPSLSWSERTRKKNKDGYGRYLSWLHREGLLNDGERTADRITPERVAAYVAHLKLQVSPVSVATSVGAFTSAARALSPDTDWSWLSLRSARLKLKAKPSREKRYAMRWRSTASG